MGILSLTCPHCLTENVAATSVAQIRHHADKHLFSVFFVCNRCQRGIGATIQQTASTKTSPHDYGGDVREIQFSDIKDIYPKPRLLDAPANVPDTVRRLYLQAADNIRRENFDAGGMTCRKVLDVSLRALDPTLKGRLQTRIDAMAEKHTITPAMKEWAHAIRLDGNDATHEDDLFDQKSAKDLLSFTEVFLMYAFTLPGMLVERQKRPAT